MDGPLIIHSGQNFSTANSLKYYTLVQLIFGCYIILPIKHNMDRELMGNKKQAQIDKDNICDNIKIVDYNYKVGDKVILRNKSA